MQHKKNKPRFVNSSVSLFLFFVPLIFARSRLYRNLRDTTSARRNEFMPGTKHRLVTLAGPPLAVNMARFLIMRKIQTEKEKL